MKLDASLSCYHDCPSDDRAGQDAKVLCAWIGTSSVSFGSRPRRAPRILILQPSRGLGGKAASKGCYERIGIMNFDFEYGIEEKRMMIDWFKDAEVETTTVV